MHRRFDFVAEPLSLFLWSAVMHHVMHHRFHLRRSRLSFSLECR